MVIKRNCWKGTCRCTSSGFVRSISCLCCLFSTTSLNSSLDTCFHTKFAFVRVNNLQAVQTTGKTNGSWVVGKFKATSLSQFIKKDRKSGHKCCAAASCNRSDNRSDLHVHLYHFMSFHQTHNKERSGKF